VTVLSTQSNESALSSGKRNVKTFSSKDTWVSEGFFPRRVSVVNFPGGGQKDFSRGGNSGEISFYQLETRENYFSTERLIGKYQISKSREQAPLPAPPFRRPCKDTTDYYVCNCHLCNSEIVYVSSAWICFILDIASSRMISFQIVKLVNWNFYLSFFCQTYSKTQSNT